MSNSNDNVIVHTVDNVSDNDGYFYVWGYFSNSWSGVSCENFKFILARTVSKESFDMWFDKIIQFGYDEIGYNLPPESSVVFRFNPKKNS